MERDVPESCTGGLLLVSSRPLMLPNRLSV